MKFHFFPLELEIRINNTCW